MKRLSLVMLAARRADGEVSDEEWCRHFHSGVVRALLRCHDVAGDSAGTLRDIIAGDEIDPADIARVCDALEASTALPKS